VYTTTAADAVTNGSVTGSGTASGTAGITVTAPTNKITVLYLALPAFTSANKITATVSTAFSFTVQTTGSPTPAITENGALPSNLTLTDNGNGTATISGTPAPGTGGVYPIVLRAANLAGPATQAFTLTVRQAPGITSTPTNKAIVGKHFFFTVATTGYPAPSLSRSGSLPPGLYFEDNGDGTATIAGTPSRSGVFTFTLVAVNATGRATQAVTITVYQAPEITSTDSKSATVGTAFSFTVKTTGSPAAAISKSGALPSKLTLTDNGNGTATISGTPAAGTGGEYPIVLRATNLAGTDTQDFTLTVRQAPGITSVASATAKVGVPFSFTFTTTGYPTASLSRSGTVPAGLSFSDNGDGTATLSGTPTKAITRTLTISAGNGVSPRATQSFTVTVNP
jgi:hypothetical protein